LFSQSTTTALKSIRQNEGLIKKVYVPKMLYPMSAVVFNYILFVISLVVLAGVSLALGVYPTMSIFKIVIPLGILFVMSIGVGLVLSTFGTFFRDLEYLWNVALMLIMYASAIFYYPDVILESGVSFILKFNPLFCVISNFRSCLFGQELDTWMLGYSAIFAVISVVVGYAFFERNKNKFILHL